MIYCKTRTDALALAELSDELEAYEFEGTFIVAAPADAPKGLTPAERRRSPRADFRVPIMRFDVAEAS